jgi:uncharacterized protein YciI
MAWLILAEDGERGPELRADKALMAAMWAWELSIKDCVLAAGSLRSDDGRTPVGSLMILDVATKDEAMAIFATDPATVAGLRGKVTVRFWNRAILDGVAVD